MTDRNGKAIRGARALLLGAALVVAAPLMAKDVYKAYLDPARPHHRAILDTIEKLKTSPNDAGLHNDLGCLVAWDGFWRDALNEFTTAAKLDKKDARPLFNAGLVEASRGSWRAARHDFSAARRRDPGNWPAWWMLGFSEERLGNVEAAVAAYKVSLRVDTSLFDVTKNPFADDSRLRARVLLETYQTRLVRAALPAREEFAEPARIERFFQPTATPAAPKPPEHSEEVRSHTGPIVTTAPPPSSGAPSHPTAPPVWSRGAGRPVVQPAPPPHDQNSDQAAPPDNLPFNKVTPAPKKEPRPPVMGPGGAPDE